MTKHLLVSTPDENGNFTHAKFYKDDLDEVISEFEKKLNNDIVDFCEKYKIHLFIKQISGKKEIEVSALIDNEKSIF
jgi:hypothetical protein